MLIFDGYRELITYDLVSRGSNECWGTYTDGKGWGGAYENSCIHSGTIKTSGDLPTSWYNYTLASAGTIIDKGTSSENPAFNANKAIESICPKGWILPTNAQFNSNTSIANFSPVSGGNYNNGRLYNESTHGFWWSSGAHNSVLRYRMTYNGSSLYANDASRRDYGHYIRCVPAP